jgi:hypothetical protein
LQIGDLDELEIHGKIDIAHPNVVTVGEIIPGLFGHRGIAMRAEILDGSLGQIEQVSFRIGIRQFFKIRNRRGVGFGAVEKEGAEKEAEKASAPF